MTRWTFAAFLPLVLGPSLVRADPCPDGPVMALIEGRGMGWFAPGFEPEQLSGLDRSAILGLASSWANAYTGAGANSVVLPSLAKAVSSWGAVEVHPGRTFGRYDFFVLDAIVEAYGGKAVLVLSPEAAFDHAEGILPSDAGGFKAYVKAVVERYDGDVDFGIAAGDTEAYPDVDGSGKVTPADWEDTAESLVLKQQWADRHRVHAFQVGTEACPAGVAPDQYASVFLLASEAARSADPGADLWIAPIDVAAIKKDDFLARFKGLSPAVSGTIQASTVLVSLPALGADPTLQAGVARLKTIVGWLDEAGFEPGGPGGLRLVLGPARIGWKKVADACTSDRCDETGQAEQVAKLAALAALHGFDGLAFDGIWEDPASGTGYGLGTLDVGTDHAVGTPRPALFVAGLLARTLAVGGEFTEPKTGVPATHVVAGPTCSGAARVAWYDWTLEAGPGDPYDSGKFKIVQADVPAGIASAVVLAPDGAGKAVSLDGSKVLSGGFPDAPGAKFAANVATLRLGRTPVLVVAGAGPAVEPTPDATGADVTADVAEPSTGKGGGCAAGAGGGWAWMGLLAFLAGVRRRARE
jgi:hypothetical protein